MPGIKPGKVAYKAYIPPNRHGNPGSFCKGTVSKALLSLVWCPQIWGSQYWGGIKVIFIHFCCPCPLHSDLTESRSECPNSERLPIMTFHDPQLLYLTSHPDSQPPHILALVHLLSLFFPQSSHQSDEPALRKSLKTDLLQPIVFFLIPRPTSFFQMCDTLQLRCSLFKNYYPTVLKWHI